MPDERTQFKRVDYDVGGLLHYLDIGDIGLPDIQRPFVWSAAKVRDLFDSMYRGFPVGYLILWANGGTDTERRVGIGERAHAPSLLIIDGQQRLTSLYAVFRGKPVLDDEYRERKIEIAFRPSDGKFEVADAAIQRDPEFVSNISVLWTSGMSTWSLVNSFLHTLQSSRPVDAVEKETISHNFDRLSGLLKYPLTALEIAHTVDDEQAAEIFVRINSQGVNLNQGDFILTLLSVFWDTGRRELEQFCKASRTAPSTGSGPSPYNHFIEPGPDELLRVETAIAFHRARLKNVYQVLRGKDLETGEFSPIRREEQFARLREAQGVVLNLRHWHQFFSSLVGAGFRSGELISSNIALIYAYTFYLVAKTRFDVTENLLQRLIARWFYATTLSGRYSGSFETVMEADLARVRNLTDPTAFTSALERIISDTMTPDFWNITLPNDLETSSPRSPALYAFYAAQNLLGAPVLFSHKKVSELLDPTTRATKKPLERHHLFPRGWLESNGVTDLKLINQVANYALVEWPDNIDISDLSPAEYVPEIRARFEAPVWARMCDLHAMPDGWEHLPYQEFLKQRRVLMARVIRRGFEHLQVLPS